MKLKEQIDVLKHINILKYNLLDRDSVYFVFHDFQMYGCVYVIVRCMIVCM